MMERGGRKVWCNMMTSMPHSLNMDTKAPFFNKTDKLNSQLCHKEIAIPYKHLQKATELSILEMNYWG